MKLFLLFALTLTFQVQAKVKVKFATVAPDGTPWAQTLDDLKKDIEKNSKGSIAFKNYMGGQLGGELESLQKIRRGNIQGGGITSAALASVVPEIEVLELPYLFDSYEQADYVLDNLLYTKFQEIFEKKGLILVAWSENGLRSIGHASKKISKPSDLVGEKMRSQESKVHLAFWKKVGASPQAISVTEALPALQTGVVKGFDNTPLFTLAAEWHTAIKHFTLTQHIYQPGAIVYSKRFWKKLSADQQKILMGPANGLAAPSRVAIRAMESELTTVLKEMGIAVHSLSKEERENFKKVLLPIHKQLIQEIGGNAQEVYDLIQKGKEQFAK